MPSIHHPPIHQHTSSSIYPAITINIPSIHLSQSLSHQRDPFPTHLQLYIYIYIYRYPHTRAHTHTPVCLSVISSAHLSAPSALHPSPHVSFYPPAHPSLTGRFSAGFTTRGHATFAIYHRIRALASSRSHPSHALVGQERGCHGVSCWTRCLEPARGTW